MIIHVSILCHYVLVESAVLHINPFACRGVVIFSISTSFSVLECFFCQFLSTFTNYLHFSYVKLLFLAFCGEFRVALLVSVAIFVAYLCEFLLAFAVCACGICCSGF